MAATYQIHPVTPEAHKIAQVVQSLRNGGVLLYPTDTGFALGCDLSHKEAIQRVRSLRNLPDGKPLTFLCESLTNISEFAKVSNAAYKIIKRLIPGPYTFILPASRSVPRYAQDPKRKTTGIRVPNNPLCNALLRELGNPVISISAKAENGSTDVDDIIAFLGKQVDVVLTLSEYNFTGESTVIDMTTDDFAVVREGAGISEAYQFVDSIAA